MPPKLLAGIGFLYQVVHKIGRLRKFNRSREIELNFTSTISMKFGTLVQHAPGYKTMPRFLIFAQGLSYGLSKAKNGEKSSLNFERSQLHPFEATFWRSPLLLSFCENRFRPLRCVKKLNSTKKGALLRHFCVSNVITTAHAHKMVSFSCFSTTFQIKKIKKLRPKMTKIASICKGVLPFNKVSRDTFYFPWKRKFSFFSH